LELLKKDIVDKAEKYVKKSVTAKLTQNQFDALVILTFNIGGSSAGFEGSTVLKKVNAGEVDKTVMENAFNMWNKGTVDGKKVELAGLTKRRKADAKIYTDNVYDSTH
jgi:lysozyme